MASTMNLAGLARSLTICVILLSTPLFAGEPMVNFTRDGQDLISAASFASSEDLAFAYDASFGQMSRIEGSVYSLSLTCDPLLYLTLAQTILHASERVLLTAAMTYEAGGLRASRTLSAGAASSSTSYWYGGSLHPLVIERDGGTYRLIGKGVVEALTGSQLTRSYAHADHLGSPMPPTMAQPASPGRAPPPRTTAWRASTASRARSRTSSPCPSSASTMR